MSVSVPIRCAVGAAAIAAVLGPAIFPAPADAVAVARLRPASASLHVYVSEPQKHQILRFALDQAGLPAAKPDAVITGLQSPRGLAIGPDGRLYVVDNVAHELAIFEPGPGNGSKPSHVLVLPTESGEAAVGVDAAGRVYVGYNTPCEMGPCGNANVYPPLPSGHTAPIAHYGLGGAPPALPPSALAVNAGHELLSIAEGQPDVYGKAPNDTNQMPYPLFCPAIVGWGGVWGPGREIIATDISGENSPRITVTPDYTKGTIPNCPASYSITSATVPLDHPYGLAYDSGKIYVTSAYNAQVKSALLFVFDPTKAGPQIPRALVSGPPSLLALPFAVAVGP